MMTDDIGRDGAWHTLASAARTVILECDYGDGTCAPSLGAIDNLRVALASLPDTILAADGPEEVASSGYPIDKGVPVPRANVGRLGGASPKYPWRRMEIGDSFFAATTQDLIKGARHYAQIATGWRFVTRIVPGGVRVWRAPTKDIAPEQPA